jgi:hypothetical protein
MKKALSALSMHAALVVHAQALPEDTARFLSERKICEHFLGEPVEGRTLEQQERRDFVADSIDIYCSGTDKRLAALKRRYSKDASIMTILNALEEKLE